MFEAWADPRLVPFAIGTWAVSGVAFLAFALPWTALAWFDPPWARRWRIQPAAERDRAQVIPALRSFVLNNLLLLAVTVAGWPLLARSSIHLGPEPAWYVHLGLVVAFIYADDVAYWFVHKAMHRGWLWRHVHSVHHRVVTPWAISGHLMHPLEYLTTAGLMLTVPVLLGVHVHTIWIWAVVRQWEAAEGHCGYDLPFSPTHLLPGSDGARHHDAHHAKVNGNFAGFLAWFDAWRGTLAKGYRR